LRKSVNNDFYNDLGEKWETALDHPIALLRAENRLRNPWIASKLPSPCTVLDLGCGAGFLTNELAKLGHRVTGVDLSENSLEVAQRLDATKQVQYLKADATATALESASFDAVCAMDILEHVQDPAALVKEASRLLKPNGLFFFHTFNRNLLSWLVVIKGVEWCVKNAPPDMHLLQFFIKPEELTQICATHHLIVEEMLGVNVKFTSLAFWKMVFKREVPADLEFIFSDSLRTGYSGWARKNS
jgi:2-polyprenyl-6-hydroxyphenyl methylase / 3-demethylubiquinone-9 3-methyltransferase